MSSKRPRLERRVSSVPSLLPRTCIARPGYMAEIIHDRRAGLHYCVIQPEGLRDILWLGQCTSAADARHVALKRMQELALSAGHAAGD